MSDNKDDLPFLPDYEDENEIHFLEAEADSIAADKAIKDFENRS